MADIRINSLPTTASASSSDDFLALDGATNGTRKLNAYSPTFGGNLTVSGTGGFGGSTGPHTFGNGGGAVEVRAVGDSSGYYGYALYTGGSYESSLKHSASTAITKLDVGRNSAWGGAFEIYADTTRAARFAKTSTTLDGNLTVSGGTITGGTSGMSLASGGTNQSVTLTPNGTGATIAASSGADSVPALGAAGGRFRISTSGFGMLMGSDSTGAGWIQQQRVDGTATSYPLWLQPNGGNVLVGTTTDGGQKLQVSGTAYVSGNVGIGTISAAYSLQVSSADTASYYPLALSSGVIGTIGNTVGMRFGYTGNTYQKGAIIYESTSSNGVGKLHFALNAAENSNNVTLADSKFVLTSSGDATFAGAVTVSGADKVLTVTSSASTPGFTMRQTGGIAANRNWGIVINNSANGDFILRRSTTTSGDPTTAVLTFDSTGDATFAGTVRINGNVGFYNQAPVAKPTGVAVTAAAIHAALVTLNLISA